MRSFGDLLHTIQEGGARGIDEKTLFFLFVKIIKEEYGMRGEQIISPLTFKDGILSVKTKNPLWANEIWLHRDKLIQKINQLAGGDVVCGLKLLH